jgi:hypothetical protein
VDLHSVLVFMLVFKEKWRVNLKLNTIHIQIIRKQYKSYLENSSRSLNF